MHRFVAQANVDHFIGHLTGSDLTPDKRTSITKLLIAELDKLAHDLEHLEFAEKRAAEGRTRVNQVRDMRDGHPFGTPQREQAERLLVNCENLQTVLEDFCHRLRAKINSPGGTISTGPRRNLIC
ncbi:hypothetical protein [Bradyrhizobium sp. BR13661]|jgi:hypothetical protein|uniref:hypothetical protein n=1 Tax=Bradyrhizobium sp. BR13661 TaxID=2940622 RepID=UPI002474B2D3|nr:hypothetical protein [Bradyrhizobium sp. BR13661]MDH6262435.1 hypothetical protein [Bradyrhizobium sp. BR13661]